MEKIIKYSILRYFPTLFGGESINLGILFSDVKTGFCSFRYTSNLQRVQSFDDEIDRRSLVNLLEGIRQEVSNQSENGEFDLDGFIKYYINNYAFDKPQLVKYDDLERTTEELYRTFFRFDYPKNERPDKNQDKKILTNLILSNGWELKNKKVSGVYDENIS